LRFVGTYSGDGSPTYQWNTSTWAHATLDGTRIGLNPKWYGDPSGYMQSLKYSVESGWHPVGTDNFESVLTHEFGHQVENWLLSQNTTTFRDVVTVDGFGIVSDTVGLWNNSNSPTKKLSGYAVTTNNDYRKAEGWAEAFATFYHTDRRDRVTYAKRLEALLAEIADTSKWVRYETSADIPFTSDLPREERAAANQKADEEKKRLNIK
jgi:hypothetical protein